MKNKILYVASVLMLLMLQNTFATTAIGQNPKPKKVLVVGGGSSHDYTTWYKKEDTQFLNSFDHLSVNYTENTDSIRHYLKTVDVLVLVNNQPIPAASQKAIEQFVQQGKPLVLLHAAVWYNWDEWPTYNKQFVGGGSKSHEQFQEFKNLVVNTAHPITQNVSSQFNFKDELYRHEPLVDGPGIQVLVVGESLETGKVYPAVFTVNHPKSKIVGITLGHDENSHLNKDYKTLLINSINWTLNK